MNENEDITIIGEKGDITKGIANGIANGYRRYN